jgi:type II secretory pathway component PulJ
MFKQPSKQAGSGLLELLIAVTVSLIAVTAMVTLMASTLGAGKESLENSRLTNELRSAMQIISRDLRRANYNEEFLTCIGAGGNNPCTGVSDTVTVSSNCLAYSYERANGTLFGAYRLEGGALQMRMDAASCGDSSAWQDLTDADQVVITAFQVTDSDGAGLTYVGSVTPSLDQRVRKVRLAMTGKLCQARDGEGACTQYAQRSIANIVKVRNNIVFASSS